LAEAVLKGDFKSCQRLLVQGAQPNSWVRDDKKLSCLHAAVKRGSSKIVKLLLFYRADIESRSAEQRENYSLSPLQLAVYSGRYDCVKILINNGANNVPVFGYGCCEKPIDMAIQSGAKGWREIVKLFEETMELNPLAIKAIYHQPQRTFTVRKPCGSLLL
jgi:ankyrin repeat protein